MAPAADSGGFASRFGAAVRALWHGRAEPDRLGELIARAGMRWRDVSVLRAYAGYLRQAGFPYSSAYVADTLCRYPAVAAALIDYFIVRFDPAAPCADGGDAAAARVSASIEEVGGLDGTGCCARCRKSCAIRCVPITFSLRNRKCRP
ncbi:hypothetical protein ACWDO0_22195 [Nocardia rhamnosiphila]